MILDGYTNDDKLKNIIDLIKVVDIFDFYKAFKNKLSNLIDSDENNMFFILFSKLIQISLNIFILY